VPSSSGSTTSTECSNQARSSAASTIYGVRCRGSSAGFT
jgi:hypothetical protein